MNARIRSVLLAALAGGALLNLAAGARRPLVERRILSQGHYPEADRAAEAVRRFVPPGAPLALVGYEGDTLGELDCAIWADYRFKWLLYPRRFDAYQETVSRELRLRRSYSTLDESYRPVPDFGADRYVLFFRVTSPPEFPGPRLRVLARGEMFLLAQVLQP